MIKLDSNLKPIPPRNWNRGIQKMNLSSEIDKIISEMKRDVRDKILDRGYFEDFAHNIDTKNQPDFFGSGISLFIERDEEREGRAFLGIAVLHPEAKMDAANYLMNGDRETILKYMQDPQFKDKLQEKIQKLSDSLKM